MASTSKSKVATITPGDEHCRALGEAFLALFETQRAVLTADKSNKVVDAEGKTVTQAVLDRAAKDLAEAIGHAHRDIKRLARRERTGTRQTTRVAVLSDTLFGMLNEASQAEFGSSLNELNSHLVPAAAEVNVVETARQAPRVLTLMMAPFARKLTIKGKEQTKYVVDKTFKKLFSRSDSAVLMLDGERVTPSRGGDYHSAKDVEALSLYKNVERSTIFEYLSKSHPNDKGKQTQTFTEIKDDSGETYTVFTPTTMVRSIVALCTVPESFLTEEERAVTKEFKEINVMDNAEFMANFSKK